MWNQLPEEEDLTEERREMQSEDPASVPRKMSSYSPLVTWHSIKIHSKGIEETSIEMSKEAGHRRFTQTKQHQTYKLC